jgi:hypothetical protein
MTKHPEPDSSQARQAGTEIEITPEMIEAGIVELRDHSLAGDMRYMVQGVYRAMEYARRASLHNQGLGLGD